MPWSEWSSARASLNALKSYSMVSRAEKVWHKNTLGNLVLVIAGGLADPSKPLVEFIPEVVAGKQLVLLPLGSKFSFEY
jgi:hypothetical protein